MDPAWVTAVISLATVLAGLAVWASRGLWRIGKRVYQFLDDFLGEPARDGVEARAGVMARMQAVEKLVTSTAADVTTIKAQVFPNGGSSMADQVRSTAGDVAGLKETVAAMSARNELFEKQRMARDGS